MLLVSCKKRVSFDGYVYSKYNVPLRDVRVRLGIHATSSSYSTYDEYTKTDSTGHFIFDFEPEKRRAFLKIECFCDSGRVNDDYDNFREIDGKTIYLHLK